MSGGDWGTFPPRLLWESWTHWRNTRNQLYDLGVMLERHRLKQLEEAVPAQETHPDRIKRVHESSVTGEPVSPSGDLHVHRDIMEVAGIGAGDPRCRLELTRTDEDTDLFPELSRKRAVIRPGVNHAGKTKREPLPLVLQHRLDLGACHSDASRKGGRRQ